MSIFRLISILVAAGACAVVFGGTKYRVISTGINCDPFKITENGFMAMDTYPSAKVWDPARGVIEVPGFGFEVAIQDINIHGQAVGWAFKNLGGNTFREQAFIWDQVQGTRELANFGYGSEAYGVNDNGTVVGRYWRWDLGLMVAFKWQADQGWTDLPPKYGGWAGAMSINNAQEVLGYSKNDDPDLNTSVIWRPDGSITDLGNLFTQHQNFAQSLNENGYVSGGTYGNLGDIGYIWSPTTGYTAVWNPFQAGLYITVSGINESLVGVGTMSVPNVGLKGFIRQTNGTIQLLNSLLQQSMAGWDIREAYDINNKGQISAVGWINGQRRGVMLQPVKDKTPIGIGRGPG